VGDNNIIIKGNKNNFSMATTVATATNGSATGSTQVNQASGSSAQENLAAKFGGTEASALRAEGMGWGLAARSLGVHPGRGDNPQRMTSLSASESGAFSRDTASREGKTKKH
jgi:hypothetical protein